MPRRSLGAVLLLALTGGLSAAPVAEPLNLNTASVEQLEALPGLGGDRARMMVRLREKNGPFRSVLELRALPRLTEKQFESLRERLYVVPATREKQSSAGEAVAPIRALKPRD